MKKFNYFYRITNTLNNKFYYGVHQTNNLNDGYMGSGLRIKRAIKKYGLEFFKKEAIDFFYTFEEALDYEAEIVNEVLIKDPNCYNLKLGGKGGFSSEERYKGGISMLNKIWNDPAFIKRNQERLSKLGKENYENGKFIPYDFKGQKHTAKSKEKIGEKNKISQLGDKNSQFGTCWIYNDSISMKIDKKDLSLYLEHEWKQGRKSKNSKI